MTAPPTEERLQQIRFHAENDAQEVELHANEYVPELLAALDAQRGDVAEVLGDVAKVYDHVTGGRCSKPNTAAWQVCQLADENLQKWADDQEAEALAIAKEEHEHDIAQLRAALERLTDDGITAAVAQLEAWGLLSRYIHWTGGHQAGAYVMGPNGWQGDVGPWRKTAAEAWSDALAIGQRLYGARWAAEIEAELATSAPPTT